jgi:hypothetical protein
MEAQVGNGFKLTVTQASTVTVTSGRLTLRVGDPKLCYGVRDRDTEGHGAQDGEGGRERASERARDSEPGNARRDAAASLSLGGLRREGWLRGRDRGREGGREGLRVGGREEGGRRHESKHGEPCLRLREMTVTAGDMTAAGRN